MGYDVHITRAENWADNQGFEISSLEWINIIKNDPELILTPENGEYFVIWQGSTKYPETWFDWSNGNIYTKFPDTPTLLKMLQIAHKLNAKIQGDDGELYDEDNIKSFDDSFMDIQPSSKTPIFDKIFLTCICLILIPFLAFIIFIIIETSFH